MTDPIILQSTGNGFLRMIANWVGDENIIQFLEEHKTQQIKATFELVDSA